MSVVEQLAEMFAIDELTHPVTLEGVSTRGYFDEEAAPRQDDFGAGFLVERTFYVQRGSLPCLATTKQIRIGALAAESVTAADPLYTVREHKPIQDGLVTMIILVPETGS